MSGNRKICSFDRLLELRQNARAEGKTVVHCHGCFDVVHPGHIHHLQFAKSLGDLLVVTISADSHVNKGVNRPLIPDDLRAASLAALECVDWVYVNADPTAAGLIERLCPDVYVKGKEYEKNDDPRFVAERDAVTRHGGRVVFSSGDVVFSSTALIGQLESCQPFEQEKLRRLRQQYDLSNASLHALVSRFRGQRVVVIGDFILDRYHICEPTGIAGESPMMALRSLATHEYDGGAGVIALHLAGLGAETALVTALAGDELSRRAQDRLSSHGVRVVASNCRRQTVVKNRYLVDFAKLFKVDEGAVSPLDSHTQHVVAEQIFGVAKGATAVIFADFGYGLITAGLLRQVLPELRRHVPVITADVSGRQANLLRFRDVDLLCPTEREARETLHDYTSGLGALAWNLLRQTGSRRAMLTLGKQGLVTFEGGDNPSRLRSEYIPALSAHAVDPLGCGDALLATASLTLAAGGSLPAAALLGSLAAATEAGSLGNIPITSDRLLDYLHCCGASSPLRLAS